MGHYATLEIDDLVLFSTKGDIDPSVMMLFNENEKKIRSYSPTKTEIESNPDLQFEPKTTYKYSIKLSVAKDRLEFMGFTLHRIESLFKEGRDYKLKELSERKNHPFWKKNKQYKVFLNREINIMKELTLNNWLDSFAFIVKNKLQSNSKYWYEDKPSKIKLSKLQRYMLGNTPDACFGFPTFDFRAFMRAAVEITGIDAELVYDLTDLLEGEYITTEENLCAYARREMTEEFIINHKIIVLTEGNSDKLVLERAMKLLYPHLFEYYSFMDFEGTKAPGGASALVSTVKAFIGAGIVNRVIALFDNDTAARSAVRALIGLSIPPNVRILHYPQIPFACDYPTMGPQGLINMDVNGLAGSIEIYFGKDVLITDGGEYTPVKWRGYDEGLHQYQGEIINKVELQSRFIEKLEDCISNKESIIKYDWSGINAILDIIRTAFHQ